MSVRRPPTLSASGPAMSEKAAVHGGEVEKLRGLEIASLNLDVQR